MRAYYEVNGRVMITDIPDNKYTLVTRFEDMNAETEFTLHVKYGHHMDEVEYEGKTYYTIAPHEFKKVQVSLAMTSEGE